MTGETGLPLDRPSRWRPSGSALGLLALMLLFMALLAWRGQFSRFFDPVNLKGLLHENSAHAVAGLGLFLIILSGGIDLSVGSVVALVTVVAMQSYILVL